MDLNTNVANDEQQIYQSHLSIDLQPLIDELSLLSYSELAAQNEEDSSSKLNQIQLEIQKNLIQTIADLREQIKKAIDATKNLPGCDIDSEAQQKLLLSMGISLTAKRQLIHKLNTEINDILNT